MLLVACTGDPSNQDTPGSSASSAKPTSTSSLFPVTSFDDLSAQLAKRTQEKLGGAADFQVVVTQAVYPIGTLLRQGSTIPIDYSSCVPVTTPPAFGAPSLFPSYSLTRETAAAFGLDDAVLQGVAKAGAKLSRTSGVKLDFADSKISTLSDHDIKTLANVPACSELLSEGPVWLVRGYVFGKRSFRFERAQANDANLSVTKIASFDVKVADGNSGLVISDNDPVGFLQIVSALAPKPAPALAPNAPAISVAKPEVGQLAGKVFIQRDTTDTSGADVKVIAALDAANLKVVQKVETVPSTKMPLVAQVRYFNDSDLPLAKTALAALATSFSNAKLVRISLPSPAGQLEVWLPKAGARAVNPLAVSKSPAAASILLKL
jgi:hypothetical protein